MDRPTAAKLTPVQCDALKTIPTCFLQWELESREGVQHRTIMPEESMEISVNGTVWASERGALTVTINQD